MAQIKICAKVREKRKIDSILFIIHQIINHFPLNNNNNKTTYIDVEPKLYQSLCQVLGL